MNNNYIKSPLNYTGGKIKLLPQLLPLFPSRINKFVDLFCGGCDISVNVEANEILCNDIINYVVELYNYLKINNLKESIQYIDNRIEEFRLTKTNLEGYNSLRSVYNKDRFILDFFVLICFSFNNQARFNNKQEYNQAFGRNRSDFNERMRSNLIKFTQTIKNKNIKFISNDYMSVNLDDLTDDDFVYCDPPYLITTCNYNDGKRGFKGWNEVEEYKLLSLLNSLHNRNVKFGLSNVFENKGKSNYILKEWAKNYNVHYLNNTYGNCNHQAKDKSKDTTVEVLVTNY